LDQLIATEFLLSQARLPEVGTSEVEHLRRRPSLEQFLYLGATERVLEEITFIYLNVFLRKELLRFAAGVSFGPTVELDYRCHSPALLLPGSRNVVSDVQAISASKGTALSSPKAF